MEKVSFENLVEESIISLVESVDIDKLINKHLKKVHFIPIKYRVLNGFLQSLNIKYGDFIQTLVSKIISSCSDLEVILSKRKDIRLELNPECERIINYHIDHPLKDKDEILRKLPIRLEKLYDNIFYYQLSGEHFARRTLDVDVLLRHISKDIYYYVEIKYNDDHDTGKFININRKLLKTYAGLIRYLNVKSKKRFKPILYYFNYFKRYYPNPYLREGIEILRGKELFQKFNLPINYRDIQKKLLELEDSLEERFDKFKEEIFRKVKERTKGKQTILI